MQTQEEERVFLQRVSAATIRVALLGGLIVWCLQIVLPFVIPILWGAILATAVLPLTRRLFPQRDRVGAISFGVFGLLLIVVPSWLFLGSIGEAALHVGKQMAHGELKVPPPRPGIADWPLVGERLHALWSAAATAPSAVVEAHLPQLREAGRWLMRSLGGLTLGILQSLFAVGVAAAFLMNAAATHRTLVPVVDRVAPQRGAHLLDLAAATVRGVTKGVLGVAALQALLAWIGMAVAGVPAAAALTLLVLIAGVAQLPTILVLGPIAAYVFTSSDTNVAIGFLIWSALVSLSDNVLKPLLLGRGARVPTLVIVVGAIGGMLSSGIIGLFVGSVVLAVGYELFVAWVHGREIEPTPAGTRASEEPTT